MFLRATVRPQEADTMKRMAPLIIRLADVRDAQRVKDFLGSLTPETRWQRYHRAVPIVKEWMVDDVVALDPNLHGSLVAIADDRIVGLAEWARFDPDDALADIAIVLGED